MGPRRLLVLIAALGALTVAVLLVTLLLQRTCRRARRAERLAQRLGQYALEEKIGEGGMGGVRGNSKKPSCAAWPRSRPALRDGARCRGCARAAPRRIGGGSRRRKKWCVAHPQVVQRAANTDSDSQTSTLIIELGGRLHGTSPQGTLAARK